MSRVVTLTVNPALDETSGVDRIEVGPKLRCDRPEQQPGGGGVNVARVACRLGAEARAVWTRGGVVGQRYEELLEAEGVAHVPVPVSGDTRRSVTICERDSGEQVRFVYPGPELGEADAEAILEQLSELRSDDLLVLSGSLPPGLDEGFYAEALRCAPEGCRTVVDTHGPPLRHALQVGVELIKPNREELAQLVERDLDDDDAVGEAARELLGEGCARVVVVSLDRRGALLVTDDGAERLDAPQVEAVSAVGAGDSTVAGIVVGLARGLDLRDAVELGMAAGAAAVTTPGTDLAHRDRIEELWGRALPD